MDYKERIDKIERESLAKGLQTELADEIAALRKDLGKKVTEDLCARAKELLKEIRVPGDEKDSDETGDPVEDLLNSITAK